MTFIDEVIADLDFIFTDAGLDATYTPSTAGVQPFTVRAVLSATFRDEYETNDTRIKMECRIRHSDLEAHNLDEPIDQVRGGTADTLSIPGPDGTTEVWTVTGKTYSSGVWVLSLSRNIRVRS